MTYPEAIQFLQGLQMFGARLGLETTRQLAAGVGSPHAKLRFIHVAGTNGKGSTCAMLESIYRAAGLRVGLFTSPHLVSFRERIQINRQLISEADVARLVDATKIFARQTETTFFEFVTVLALQYFAEQKCNLVIWETGLGGRLDATNIVTPLVSVITNIGFDHQQWLGDTLAQIAAEKAGIFKPGVPVVTATEPPEALAVIKETARQADASLSVIGRGHAAATAKRFSLSLVGEHQQVNAALAVQVVEVLQAQIPVDETAIRQGLESVNWPGRLQLIVRPDGQRVLLDGAHNPTGAEALHSALQRGGVLGDCTPPGRTLILGTMADKNWRQMCESLAPLANQILVVPVTSARSAKPADLAAACAQANPAAKITVCSGIVEALAQSRDHQFVLITGSLYLVGEALATLPRSGAEAPNEFGLNNWQLNQPPN